jgi:hypothetical protein
MNHYYIDFMISERRRDEREECERRRRLNPVGHSHPGPMQKAGNIVVGMVRRIREQMESRNGNRQLDARLSVANNMAHPNGEGR